MKYEIMATDSIGGHDLEVRKYWKPSVQISGARDDESHILCFAMPLNMPADSIVFKISPC